MDQMIARLDRADLIDRLEKAAGHDDGLNDAIAVSQGWKPHRTKVDDLEFTTWTTPSGEKRSLCPWYTSSIDAALALVPEGWAWRVMQEGPFATGRASKPRAELAEPVDEFGPGVGVRAQVEAATPAIALCIAALKVR